MRTISIILALTFFCISVAFSSDISFDEINDHLGLCPYSENISAVPKNASYAAFVCDADRFSQVLKSAKQGDKVVMSNLGDDKWHILVRDQVVRITLERSRFNYQRRPGGHFQLTKICINCGK
ncbi:MAG: hypothetical protein K9L30_06025 [Desulfobacterales bacterium]|nr:hypothetical protein [Desulfobacterales bacterium]